MQGKKRKERKESEIKGKAIYSGLSERKKKGQKWIDWELGTNNEKTITLNNLKLLYKMNGP